MLKMDHLKMTVGWVSVVIRTSAVVCFASLWGCAATPHMELQEHMLNIDANGGVDTEYVPTQDIYLQTDDLPPWSEKVCREARKHKTQQGVNLSRSIDRIMKGFDAYARERLNHGRQVRVMLILHGGLVSIKSGIDDANKTIEAMGSDRDFYPIFLNWETGFRRSYFDHLLRVRKGERQKPIVGWSTAPFVAFADLGRAVGRLPIFLYGQTEYLVVGARRDGRFHHSEVSVDERIPVGWEQSVELPPKEDQPKGSLVELIPAVVPGAMRVITTPIADFAGTGAYNNMLRRSRLMFLQDDDFKRMRHMECGGLSRLMEELRAYELYTVKQFKKTNSGNRNRGDDLVTRLRSLQVERRSLPSRETRAIVSRLNGLDQQLSEATNVLPITVIAHSMGGIVSNELLHRNSDLYFDNVVYMAAANSTKDFAALALPYLEANPTTHFYSLSLHPYREVNEISGYQMVPEGSLLTWLDRFVSNSRTKMDYTLGTWNNAAQSLAVTAYLEDDVRERFSIKVFDSSDATPQKHGDFNDPPCVDNECPQKGYQGGQFWKPEFWQIAR